MAPTMKLSEDAQNTGADAVAALLTGGLLVIYSGDQPIDPDAKPNGSVLAQIPFDGGRAFSRAVRGQATSRKFPAVKSIRSGRATWFRAFSAKGHPIFDGSAGTSASNLILKHADFEEEDLIDIESVTFVHGGG